MGRKIPGRKHRGVKDPEQQRAEQFAKIKDKINAPPVNPDDQQVPKTLTRLMELRKKTRDGYYDRKKKKNKVRNETDLEMKQRQEQRGSKINSEKKYFPKFVQQSGESADAYQHRVNRVCNEMLKEAAYENKYNVNIIRNEDGEVDRVVNKPKDELETYFKSVRKAKKNPKQKLKFNNEPKLTKSQKRGLKIAAKKKKLFNQDENILDFDQKVDRVKFGEVVHAPPQLTIPKKARKMDTTQRPGEKPLILKQMLTNNQKANNTKSKEKQHQEIPKKLKGVDKKGRRKDLPNAMRRQLDKQQKEIIESYKLLKAQRLKK